MRSRSRKHGGSPLSLPHAVCPLQRCSVTTVLSVTICCHQNMLVGKLTSQWLVQGSFSQSFLSIALELSKQGLVRHEGFQPGLCVNPNSSDCLQQVLIPEAWGRGLSISFQQAPRGAEAPSWSPPWGQLWISRTVPCSCPQAKWKFLPTTSV